MCLVLIGWRAHPKYRLIVAANRDEYYTRPTAPIEWWPERPGLLAGRDLGSVNGVPGTWLGLLPAAGRFATVTNVRGPDEARPDARSRGALLMDYLTGSTAPEPFVRTVAGRSDDYNGYNLVVSDLESLWWQSNRTTATPMELSPGLHGLSNAALLGSASPGAAGLDAAGARRLEPVGSGRHGPVEDVVTDTGAAAWPKVREGVRALAAVAGSAEIDDYFDVLADRTVAPDIELPQTGLPFDQERAVSSRFVANDWHGTRCSTVLLIGEDGGYMIAERSFAEFGEPLGEVRFTGTLGD
ncbi:NRDE family protein [Nocardia vermiculata]|uniref:NRDE family protein n=1 Tax=Nocardia vermiculata TaxID=257274 RepID=A0A846XZ73_9NOCA|nr:NRDE family protein [Nocardia vermiculata]NKY52506.1 NRDE family protein [Nocardia vermiculata]